MHCMTCSYYALISVTLISDVNIHRITYNSNIGIPESARQQFRRIFFFSF